MGVLIAIEITWNWLNVRAYQHVNAILLAITLVLVGDLAAVAAMLANR